VGGGQIGQTGQGLGGGHVVGDGHVIGGGHAGAAHWPFACCVHF